MRTDNFLSCLVTLNLSEEKLSDSQASLQRLNNKVVQRWLDESDQGCVYFSFGSMTRIETFPKHILDAFYKSFANISPVRVLLKIAKPEELPPSLPSNVMTQSWFDQIQVLKHRNVKGFITHGGLMSIQESVYYEVPMVGIPLFGDQPSNVANCVKRQIAIKVDVQDISEESMTDAILKILRDSTYKEAVQKVVKKWLDESTQGCIYFSFGSMTRIETFPKNILDAFYRSFGNISPVRVLLKVAKPEELPPGLPSNVMTQSWFDQIQVLKHPNVKGFMTHGGLMSVQESIHYGVPMIAIPLGGDQHQNVAACVKRHISIKIDVQDISGESLTDALNKIVKDPSYKEAMQRVSYEFKDHLRTPLETAIYWTEYVARHGKYSLKLPAFYLPWWQASLIDVYCFVITILVSGLSISILLLIKVYRILRMRPTSHSSTRKEKNK
ncbi:hypothetical protein QAD02_000169 [Eretmocerus hayati]|uniref:Uncharacterized protein n=1 Tax=Eretmocerus hayati TaxID=131215 RepID=A0ACC2NH51_9HYME|nr:hypothetical protein QAD02_000169 [Eretmocerus hayati]